jgi:hypothetical protein
LVARVYQLLDFEIDRAEGGERIAPELPYAFVPPVDRLRIHRCPARVRDVPDDVLGVDLEGSNVVPPSDRVIDPAHDVDVLPRHRLLR